MDIDSDSDSGVSRILNRRQFDAKIAKISTHLQCGLDRLRETHPESCDVVLTVDDYSIPVHKVVLISCSSYFYAMFSKTDPYTEADSRVVNLEDIGGYYVQTLINYLYTGVLPVTSINGLELCTVARYLEMNFAEKVAIEYINHCFTLHDCFEMLKWAVTHCVEKVRNFGIKYISTHFNHLYTCNEFEDTQFNEFKMILDSKHVRKYPDDILFTTITRWLFCHGRLDLLDDLLNNTVKKVTQNLVSSIIDDSEVGLKEKIKPILNKWKDKSNAMDKKWNIILSNNIAHYCCRFLTVEKPFNFTMEILPKPYSNGCYFSYGSTAYHFGGCITKLPASNETFCYNIYTNRWLPFVPLLRPRAYHKSIVMDGRIYTFGGSDGHNTYRSVEYLDLITGKQKFLPNMIFRRESMGLSTFNNAIYVMGGCDRDMPRNRIVERYDPRADEWDVVGCITYASDIISTAAIGSNIFSTNGKGTSMECYDLLTNHPKEIASQNNGYPLRVFSYEDELYGVFQDYIGKYDSTTGGWQNEIPFPESDKFVVACPIEFLMNESEKF